MEFKIWIESLLNESQQISVLKDMLTRSPGFMPWLKEKYDEEEDQQNIMADEAWMLEEFNEYLEEEFAVNVREDGLIEFWDLDDNVRRIIGNLPVVIYHHTTSALDSTIQKDGIRSSSEAGIKKVHYTDPKEPNFIGTMRL